jgi:two-component system LytT family response regulator
MVEVRESLTSLERRLDPIRFVRVHRSAIVNRAYIREVQPWFTGEYVVLMRDGSRIVTGRSHREAVRRLIGG